MSGEEKVTMDDYITGDEPDPPNPQVNVPEDYVPHTCEHCGKSFDYLGVRATQALRTHQEFYGCPEAPDDD